jgi:hypothetical protein
MTRAELARKLIDDEGYGPIEAHEAVSTGKVPDEYRQRSTTATTRRSHSSNGRDPQKVAQDVISSI